MEFNYKAISRKQMAGVLGTTSRSKTLIDQILYWVPRTQVHRKGHLWIAKSAEEWAIESGLSTIQVRRAIDDLLGRGIIVKDRMKFYDRTILHIRLADGLEEKIKDVIETLHERGSFTALCKKNGRDLMTEVILAYFLYNSVKKFDEVFPQYDDENDDQTEEESDEKSS